jgi:hypothetical protein
VYFRWDFVRRVAGDDDAVGWEEDAVSCLFLYASVANFFDCVYVFPIGVECEVCGFDLVVVAWCAVALFASVLMDAKGGGGSAMPQMPRSSSQMLSLLCLRVLLVSVIMPTATSWSMSFGM